MSTLRAAAFGGLTMGYGFLVTKQALEPGGVYELHLVGKADGEIVPTAHEAKGEAVAWQMRAWHDPTKWYDIDKATYDQHLAFFRKYGQGECPVRFLCVGTQP